MPGIYTMSVSSLELVIRAAIVYIAVLVLLRLGGKRQMGQMTPTEFVAILLISNAVQNAMNGGDNSLTGGLLLAAVLIFLSWLISVLTFRYKKLQKIFEGAPTLLIHKGAILEKNLAKERMTHHELRTLLRKQGLHNIAEIQTAILEAEGTLSVTRMAESSASGA